MIVLDGTVLEDAVLGEGVGFIAPTPVSNTLIDATVYVSDTKRNPTYVVHSIKDDTTA